MVRYVGDHWLDAPDRLEFPFLFLLLARNDRRRCGRRPCDARADIKRASLQLFLFIKRGCFLYAEHVGFEFATRSNFECLSTALC